MSTHELVRVRELPLLIQRTHNAAQKRRLSRELRTLTACFRDERIGVQHTTIPERDQAPV